MHERISTGSTVLMGLGLGLGAAGEVLAAAGNTLLGIELVGVRLCG